jgi:hypothetical protein
VIDQIPDLAETEPNAETESLRHTDTEIESETERSKVEKITKLSSVSKKGSPKTYFSKNKEEINCNYLTDGSLRATKDFI